MTDVPPRVPSRPLRRGRRSSSSLALVLAVALGAGCVAATSASASAAATTSPTAATAGAVSAGVAAAPAAVPANVAPAATTAGDLEVSPSQLAFAGVDGEGCAAEQSVSIVSWGAAELNWTATTSAPWVQLSAATGLTPAQISATVDCAALPAGVHDATISVKVAGQTFPAQVAVAAVVNPDVPVRVATWRDDHAGAFSVSTDDGRSSGAVELMQSGVRGTFVMNGTTPPARYPQLHADGHELGSHLVSHYCERMGRATLIDEIEDNIDGAVMATGTIHDVISLVWPCGFRDIEYGVIASNYYLSARGYNINELESPTPADFMNLKSFNSPEHEPLPPPT
ncbi:BACON domain-containing protein [Microbacterium sp. JZ31]|uniref:BACON domain-containing protein n=1 Tax=Microbacterium sp. JZ31 TaxID=1906274 RepID=UPI001933C7DE|nr:hypothetical protein [Microbacterium sp. JZ31]